MGEKEGAAMEQAQQELEKRGEACGMNTRARELELADRIRRTACWGWRLQRDSFRPEIVANKSVQEQELMFSKLVLWN